MICPTFGGDYAEQKFDLPVEDRSLLCVNFQSDIIAYRKVSFEIIEELMLTFRIEKEVINSLQHSFDASVKLFG